MEENESFSLGLPFTKEIAYWKCFVLGIAFLCELPDNQFPDAVVFGVCDEQVALAIY